MVAKEDGCLILMHRIIMDCLDYSYIEVEVDHIYHINYDNRKSELRLVTHSQNHMNEKLRKNSISGVKGVYQYDQNEKWIARIGVNGKTLNLGTFDTFEDAIGARKEAEIKYFGEYNYIENGTKVLAIS